MKSYTITVNGNVYDVTVEENAAGSVAAAPKSAPLPSPKAPVAPTAPSTPSAPAGSGSIKVTAPMPGKVLKIEAAPGTSVKRGDTILVFEAMKMENSVVAPEDGTVASINCAVGDTFDAGAELASLN